MRLQRGVLVGGVEPELARALARACHVTWRRTASIAYRVKLAEEPTEATLRQLEASGFVVRRVDPTDVDETEWWTTLSGGALTMASFLKPLRRVRADELLRGVLERVAAYNSDDDKPYVVTQLVVFGSYLQSDVTELGDLDLGVRFDERRPGSADPNTLLDFAAGSGRQFDNFVERMGWGQTDLLQVLRNRSGYINVYTEDISRVTDNWEVVFKQSDDDY